MGRKKKILEPPKLHYTERTDEQTPWTGYCSGCGLWPLPVGSMFIVGNLKGSGGRGYLVVCPTCRADLKQSI